MPKGPQDQKHPADVIGNAVRVMRIATGKITEALEEKDMPPSHSGSAAVQWAAGTIYGLIKL